MCTLALALIEVKDDVANETNHTIGQTDIGKGLFVSTTTIESPGGIFGATSDVVGCHEAVSCDCGTLEEDKEGERI